MMRKSRTAAPVPQVESPVRHLPLVDRLVDTKTESRLADCFKITVTPTSGGGFRKCQHAFDGIGVQTGTFGEIAGFVFSTGT